MINTLKIQSITIKSRIHWRTILEETICNLKDITDSFLLEKSIACLRNYITNKQHERLFTEELFSLIQFYTNPNPRNSKIIAEDIDQNLFPSIFESYISKSISSTKDLEAKAAMAARLALKYRNIFVHSIEEFKSTPIPSVPRIDSLMCIFLQNFLLVFPTQIVQSFLENCYLKYRSELIYFNLYNRILKIFKLPEESACSIAEVLCCINESEKTINIIKYLICGINENLKYKLIHPEWASLFISQSLQSPFREVLEGFKNSDLPLENLLPTVTYGIYLVKFPKRLYGYTSKAQRILFHYFNDGFGEQGATFVVYLHELAHYLQRLQCKNVLQTLESKSDEYGEKEGGRELEKRLFGSYLQHFTNEAAEFIIGSECITNRFAFQEEFKKKNTVKGDSRVIGLARSETVIYLGTCASSYGKLFGL